MRAESPSDYDLVDGVDRSGLCAVAWYVYICRLNESYEAARKQLENLGTLRASENCVIVCHEDMFLSFQFACDRGDILRSRDRWHFLIVC